MVVPDKINEQSARAIFEKAIASKRAGELLEALFDGATVTIDSISHDLVIAWLAPPADDECRSSRCLDD